MTRLELADLTPDDGPLIGRLLRAQRRLEHAADPRLPARPDFTAQVERTVRGLTSGAVRGWVARRGNKPVAYLAAYGLAPAGGGAPDFGPVGSSHLEQTTVEWAVASMKDAQPALYALYTQAAEVLLKQGQTGHRTSCTALPGGLLDIWVDLGFGRNSAVVVTPVSDLPAAPRNPRPPASLTVRRASAAEADTFEDFETQLMDWHARIPIGRPDVQFSPEQARATYLEQLRQPKWAHFVAELEGEPVGWCQGSVGEPPEEWQADVVHRSWAYLGTTFVVPRLHSRGIGQAVCAALYRWLREETGAPCLYTDYATTNPVASRFWPAQGFRPLRYVLLRRWHQAAGGFT